MADNSLFIIQPYKWNGVWVFDDPNVGLDKEPFISGMPAIIEAATKKISNADKGFIAIFSKSPFPGFDVQLDLSREEMGGNWYKWGETDQEGWLCPALFKYFDQAPKHLYIKLEERR